MVELPETIADVESLEELLSRPPERLVRSMRRLDGDVMILGAGGKMGPTLARMARRALVEAENDRRVIAVSRFSDAAARNRLQAWGVETIACDLLERAAIDRLPDAANIVFMTGRKFGSTGLESLTWAMNTHLPAMVCERFANGRIVAFSTGNVYPLMPIDSGGATESEPLAPVGEYAMSCLGRERIFTHFSRESNIPMALIRLNYANEMRYGTLVDIAQQVLAETPVDVSMGYLNAIWQGDANAMALMALEHCQSPPWVVNVAGPDTLRVRDVAGKFAELFGRPVEFVGDEASDALLSNGRQGLARLGQPTVPPERMMRWIADWLTRGGPTLGKATHFQTRNGKF